MKILILLFALACDSIVYSGYINDNGLGTDCLYDEDCITKNSFCKGNKICKCKIGYQYDAGSDVCFPKEVDLRCDEDYDCSALQNAVCRYDKCQCKPNYVPSKDKSSCLPTMRLTTVCEEDTQCNTVMNRSYCDPIRRHCVCERGLRQDSIRMLCTEQIKLHDRCSETAECEAMEENRGKVVCKPTGHFLQTCECADGFEERNNTCYKAGSSQATLSAIAIVAFLLVKFIV